MSEYVQVPVSLIERAKEALLELPPSSRNAYVYSDMSDMLIRQGAIAEAIGATQQQVDDWVTIAKHYPVAKPAEPPSIEDMAPGTVVLDTYAAVCIRDEQGWLRVTPSVPGGQHRHRPFGVQSVLFDPSTIRDVRPPEDAA